MKTRTSQPKNNKYYIRQVSGGLNGAVAGEPTIKGADVLCNCVGYANGRFNEIINDPELKGTVKAFKYQLVCNAENFIESAKRQGLKISSRPTLGGIMVWQKGSTLGGGDGAGHVEVVEEIYKDGSVLCSSSGWSAWAFRTLRRNNSNGRWGQAAGYKFRGCIINPSVKNGEPVPTPKLVVDGIGGVATVSRMQEFFGTAEDGVITGQTKALAKYHTSLTSVKYGSGGSVCIKKMQAWLGVTQDGQWGKATSKALQKKLGVTQDGYFDTASMKAWQKYLNTHDKPAPPKPTKKYKVIDISYWQSHNKPKIDFKKVKADGVVGVIIRQADGTDKDSYFDEHVKGAKAAGLHVGAYVFSRAKTKAQAEKEAVNLFNACKPYAMDMPLYIDLEAKGLEKTADTVAQAFLAKIKALGGTGGVYANLTWWNDHLKKTAQGSFAMWVAQYNDTMDYKPKADVGMWQYSSSGKVDGISGNVDMNECYVAYWDKVTPVPQGYTGTFPTLRLTKTNAQVKADACEWAVRVAKYKNFHYGSNEHAYHNGCFYCGTNDKFKKGHGMKLWQYTYCCNPFVGAAWAHGGGDATAYRMCHNCDSWGFSKNEGYEKSKLFDKLGHPAKSKLQAGDVLCADSHVVLYIGNGKIAEAAHRDDNVLGSTSWNSSIAVNDLTDARYKGLPRAYRYNGKVDCDRVLSYGEYSARISDLQKYLIWYGCKLSVTGFFNASTLEAVKEFQEKELGKAKADGIVGKETIDAMKKVKK